MKKNLLCWLALAMSVIFAGSLQAQNATITDDLSHEADNSAILDIKSSTKGLLIPRLTTVERLAIVEPAYGLMVFDNDENSFYFYNGTEWKDVSTNKDAWTQELESVFLRNNGASVGIGTESPNAYVHIRMSEKRNKEGSPVFLVEDANGPITSMSADTTIIYLNDTLVNKSTRRGALTVSGRGGGKGSNDYLLVTPNFSKFSFEPILATGKRGGFAVAGFDQSKETATEYLNVSPDSTVIAFYDSVPGKGESGAFKVYALSGAKMNKAELIASLAEDANLTKFREDPNRKNGFSVIGFSDARSGDSTYFQVDEDTTYINNTLSLSGDVILDNIIAKNKIQSPTFISEALGTNVFFDDTQKGVKGGFAVGGLSGGKISKTYLSVEEDSTIITFNDTITKGVKGGFAVGGLSGGKGINNRYLDVDKYSTRIQFAPPSTGVKGGFAVGGLSGGKGGEDYLTVDRDSTIIYFDDSEAKGVKGGFAVGGLSGGKLGGYLGRFYFFVDKYNARINLATPMKGVKGGFAVGGLSGGKGDTTYFEVTPDTTFVNNKLIINEGLVTENLISNDKIESPYFSSIADSTEIIFNDTLANGEEGGFVIYGMSESKRKKRRFRVHKSSARISLDQPLPGVKGGFAVGGLSGGKGDVDFLTVEKDSTLIYFDDSGVKGVKGGFAVGGLSGGKAINRYLDVDKYSTRIQFAPPSVGVKGGFAVGGLSGGKGGVDYLTVEEDSTLIYFDDSGVKGVKGGFAVGGLSGGKAINRYLDVDKYSTRIQFAPPSVGVKGGFAVGGLSGGKGGVDYLTVEEDSTRIYFDDSGVKGVKGGFAVGGLSGGKGTNYFSVNKDVTQVNNTLIINEKIEGSSIKISGTDNNPFNVSWNDGARENYLLQMNQDTTFFHTMVKFNNGIEVNDLTVTNQADFNLLGTSILNVSGTANIDDAVNNYTTTNFLVTHSNVTLGDDASASVTINGTTTAANVTATNVTITDVLNLKPRTTFPATPSAGDLCVIATSPSVAHIYCYLGGSWVQLDN
jgi:hypothetical protein